jgi:predicted nucleic acid-binding protein
MIRVFIDSSVLFSAAYSSKGHARDLIMMAVRNEIHPVISSLVIVETRRNLENFAPDALPSLDRIFDAINSKSSTHLKLRLPRQFKSWL